jgi:hypothetical protein
MPPTHKSILLRFQIFLAKTILADNPSFVYSAITCGQSRAASKTTHRHIEPCLSAAMLSRNAPRGTSATTKGENKDEYVF